MKLADFKVEEHIIDTKDGKIFGLLYSPRHAKNRPAIIISHGFTGNYSDNIDYAQHFVKMGYVVYIFDYRGGSVNSKSDGKTTDMSLLTEAQDLEAVINNIKQLPSVNPNKIILLGKSQGGVVSAIVASEKPEEVKELVLLYPAFVIRDDMLKAFKGLSSNDIPETYKVFGEDRSEVGRKYFEDIWDYDYYDDLNKYKGPVLIIHGTNDQVVPISYSQKAADIYDNVEFYPIEKAGHGFDEKFTPEAWKLIDDFLFKNDD